ncbi:YkgJ family cysteine cluster protein [Desulfohalovibrio reitneri]|uniref:YkgJ family cysteine cluster protein n=1 Tax=Desulfohalovibrio reitneri TaxID=1307759 RepID=UPI00068F02BC|nr:YkgJ family cysteine cluster protein [Desulfohalovibrio reitneri]
MPAFVCQRCGHCCFGRGGIVLTARDVERLADHLGLSERELLDLHTEEVGGRVRLRVDKDLACVFYNPDISGCGVHPARPDVCRAWPFFHGNLIDEDSWRMTQEYCPGVRPEAGFEAFAREGREHLRREGVQQETDASAPSALRPAPDPVGNPSEES